MKCAKSFLAAMVVLGVMTICGCYTHAPDPVPAPLDLYDARSASFVAAYDELVAAVRATPDWKVRPQAHGIAGQMNDALARAEGLRPCISTKQIAESTIELAKIQIRWIASVGQPDETKLASATITHADVRRYHDDELAYNRLWEAFPWMQLYLDERIRSPWIEENVLPRLAGYARVVSVITDDSPYSWQTVTVRELDLHQFQAAVRDWLARYDNEIVGGMEAK